MFQIKGWNFTKTHIWIITKNKGKKKKRLPEIATLAGWEEEGEDEEEEGGRGCDFLWDPITSTYRTRRNPQALTTIFICMNFFILLLFIKIKNKKLWWVWAFLCLVAENEGQGSTGKYISGNLFSGIWIFFFFFWVWFGLNKSWRDL